MEDPYFTLQCKMYIKHKKSFFSSISICCSFVNKHIREKPQHFCIAEIDVPSAYPM